MLTGFVERDGRLYFRRTTCPVCGGTGRTFELSHPVRKYTSVEEWAEWTRIVIVPCVCVPESG